MDRQRPVLMPDAAEPRPPAQGALFEEPSPGDDRKPGRRGRTTTPLPVVPDAALLTLADQLGQMGGSVRLGTSSWHFPGWQGLVYGNDCATAALSREGLRAYAQHPLLRTVSLDRAFYRALDAATYAELASQVPSGFRFLVKAPAVLTDASLRDPSTARAVADNPQFLDPAFARRSVLQPLVDGLGHGPASRLGVLVLQLSPLTPRWLKDIDGLRNQVEAVCTTLRADPRWPPSAHLGVEVRDPQLLSPAWVRALKNGGAVHVLGLHDRMPAIDDQLAALRAQWPAPLIARWNLQRGLRYDEARDRFAPFDRLAAPDPDTRATLARVAAATAAAGLDVTVTINNKAEGSAPCSVRALAKAIVDAGRLRPTGHLRTVD
jgi:uncharacterized protein YecE (DUF72 family)